MRKIASIAGIMVMGFLVVCMTGWASLAIYHSDLPGDYLRAGLASLFTLVEEPSKEGTPIVTIPAG